MPPKNDVDEAFIAANWDRKATDWDLQVGEYGDRNRRLNSDPVLWRLLGDVNARRVLDAGCGTGYLSRQLARRGAHVIGVDVSRRMIEVARTRASAQRLSLQLRVDSCSTLASVDDASIDLVVANYVLMDLPSLDEAMHAFRRVLVPGGAAVVVFSHPCFPQSAGTLGPDGSTSYFFSFNYFEESLRIDPPWGHFRDDFIWFHRPLSAYWRAFRAAGFAVTDLEEPKLDETRVEELPERSLLSSRVRPFSVAFRLVALSPAEST
jgi:ubiquinone/menaquinone biosynthesis C-methylase UbiE